MAKIYAALEEDDKCDIVDTDVAVGGVEGSVVAVQEDDDLTVEIVKWPYQ